MLHYVGVINWHDNGEIYFITAGKTNNFLRDGFWKLYKDAFELLLESEFCDNNLKPISVGDLITFGYLYESFQDNGFHNGVGQESHFDCVDVEFRQAILEVYFDKGAFRVRPTKDYIITDYDGREERLIASDLDYNLLIDHIQNNVDVHIKTLKEWNDSNITTAFKEGNLEEEIRKNYGTFIIGNKFENSKTLGS